MDGQATVVTEDVRVAAKPKRRAYTAEYKRRILKEGDACATPGAVEALLRREGVVLLAPGGVAADPGPWELPVPAPKKRGRKPAPVDACDRRIAELERQLAEMTGRARRPRPSLTPKELGGRPEALTRFIIALVEERALRSTSPRSAMHRDWPGPRPTGGGAARRRIWRSQRCDGLPGRP